MYNNYTATAASDVWDVSYSSYNNNEHINNNNNNNNNNTNTNKHSNHSIGYPCYDVATFGGLRLSGTRSVQRIPVRPVLARSDLNASRSDGLESQNHGSSRPRKAFEEFPTTIVQGIISIILYIVSIIVYLISLLLSSLLINLLLLLSFLGRASSPSRGRSSTGSLPRGQPHPLGSRAPTIVIMAIIAVRYG